MKKYKRKDTGAICDVVHFDGSSASIRELIYLPVIASVLQITIKHHERNWFPDETNTVIARLNLTVNGKLLGESLAKQIELKPDTFVVWENETCEVLCLNEYGFRARYEELAIDEEK